MDYIINGFKPDSLFNIFEDISAIPRGSLNESGIADYLEKFAESRGLMHFRDSANNVLIKKDASEGYEDEPPVLFQAHTDMVCEKNSATVHDFSVDPIKLKLKGNFLSADGTTLGADDGIGVALCLALLDADIAHPEIECLFTSAEEVGLIGANAFDYSLISSRRMINLDTGSEDTVLSSCAGGVRTDITMRCDRLVAPPLKSLNIQIVGLKGGHSGAEIHLGLANANRLMGRILANLYRDEPFQLISLSGGLKSNAIPREASAQITALDVDKLTQRIKRLEVIIANELSDADAKFRVRISKGKAYKSALSFADTSRAISLMTLPQNGVITMSPKLPGLVESSTNLGVVTDNCDSLVFSFESRSSCDTRLDDILMGFERLSKLLGAEIEHSSRYPGWEYVENSALREDYCAAYERVRGMSPKVSAIHAGLECGIIKNSIPEMDIISVGPDMYSIHTPSEKLDLRSCERMWKILVAFIEKRGE